MKYIAFKGSHNEQIFDSIKGEITYKHNDLKTTHCRVVLNKKIWKRLKS